MKTIKKLCVLIFISLTSGVCSITLAGSQPPTDQAQLPDVSMSANQVIVRFKNNVQRAPVSAQQTTLFSELGVKITETIKINDGVTSLRGVKQDLVFNVLTLDGRKDLKTVLKRLNGFPAILYAEPDFIRFKSTQPNDANFAQLWGLDNSGQDNGLIDADIDAPEAWDTTTGSPNSIIGVIDTGVDYSHEDLAANMWVNPGETPNDGIDNDGNGYIDDIHGIDCINDDSDPMDDGLHGTHVSGTIAAVGNNGLGVTGVNWEAKIMALKFLGADGSGSTSDAIECLAYAVKMKNEQGIDIRITNNSWGGGGFSQSLRDVIQTSADANMLFVAAAGNNATNTDNNPSYPASYNLDNIISVAATSRTDELATFSNFGATSVDLGAPGVEILSTLSGNQYGLLSGTSMASPHVAGAAALLWSNDPSLFAIEIKNKIISQGDLVASLGNSNTASGRRLNINNALNCVLGSPVLEIITPQDQFALPTAIDAVIKARINDCGEAVTNIDVLAVPSSGDTSFALLDNGQGTDAMANDGLYTGIWQPQNPGESVTLAVNADTLLLSDSVTGSVLSNPYRIDPEHLFEWIDATSGTRLAISDTDDETETIEIGFDFDFYEVSYSQLTIDSNGFLAFVDTSRSIFGNEPIPSTLEPNGFIAPYWDDLYPGSSQTGNIYTLLEGTAPGRRMTIAWVETPFFNDNADSPVTFEVTLYEGTNDIVFQYGDAYSANSATIGIEHQSGVFGLQYLFNGEPVQIQNEQAIRFFLEDAENQPPIAQDDIANPVDSGGLVKVDVLANDSDSDGSLVPESVTIIDDPVNGLVIVDPLTGEITYFHDESTTTSDSFTYTVEDNEGAVSNIATVTIVINDDGGDLNEPPVAEDDVANLVPIGGSTTIDVLSNDSDTDGAIESGSVVIVDEPANGSVVVDLSTGEITYTHDGSATISDSFTYTVEDDEGALSNVATVTVPIEHDIGDCGMSVALDGGNDWINTPNLSFANDFTIEGWIKLEPTINFLDAFIGQEGRGADINFHAGKARLYTGRTDVVVANTTMQANTWTHLAITRSGSSLSLYLNGTLDATGVWNGTLPVKALGRGNRTTLGHLKGELDEVRFWDVARSDNQIRQNYNQSLAVGDNQGLVAYWTFNESGQVVTDSSGLGRNGSLGAGTGVGSDDPSRLISTAPFTEGCGGSNIAPVAQDDVAGPIDSGSSLAINVLANDSDSDGSLAPESVVIIDNPVNGSVLVDTLTGEITYIHDGLTTTSDSFTYTVEDNEGAVSNIATVTIVINDDGGDLNEPPVAEDDVANLVAIGGSTTIDVLSNDSDTDGAIESGSVVIVDEPANGSVVVDPSTGEITYTHDGSATTGDSFTYTVEDDEGALSNVATVTVPIEHDIGDCGMSVALDGGNDWINTPNLSFANDFTIEGWIKLEPTINFLDAFIGQEGRGADINFHAGKARLYTGRTDVVVANTTMQANTWTHLAITRSGSSLSLYLNGTLDATGVWNGTLPVKALGRGNRTTLGHLKGELDEVRFWDVARSDSQILQNYNQSLSAGDNQGLVAYWTFNESGQVVTDSSGLGRNGSLGAGTGVGSDDPSRLISTAPFTEDCGGSSNVAPVAQDDVANLVTIGGSTTIDVLSNDNDPDGAIEPGSVVIVDEPANGSVVVDPSTGEITYTHDGSATTGDSFTYTVEDDEGALSNVATVTVPIEHDIGDCGMSVALDGGNDWINTPNLSFANDFTIEGWIKLEPTINFLDAFIGQEGRGADINFHAGKARLYTGRTDVVVANTTMQANTWTHLAITRSGSSLSLYLNGTLDATGVWNGALPVKALGRGNRTTRGHLKGELDEVRFWDVARSDNQILQSYNQSLSAGDNQGLVAYWTFNESGQVVTDSSGLGRNGSLGAGTDVGSDDPLRLISTAPFTEDCG